MVEIPDRNLRLAMLQALMMLGLVSRTKGQAEAGAEGSGGESSEDAEVEPDSKEERRGYQVDDDVLESLLAHKLRPEHLARVERLYWGAAADLIYEVFAYWDGEDDVFDIADLTGIQHCRALRALVIEDVSEIRDLQPLAPLASLEEIAISGGTISDLRPLGELRKLRKLSLFHNHVSDLSPIAGLAALEHVRVEQSDVVDLSPLLALPKLGVVRVSRRFRKGEDKTFIKTRNAKVLDKLAERKVEVRIG